MELLDSKLHGSLDGDAFNNPSGVYVTNGEPHHIRIENNVIHDVNRGMYFGGARDITVRGNIIHDLSSDSFQFSSVQGSANLIENNTVHTFYQPGGAHLDFMQFLNFGAASRANENFTIRGNVYLQRGSRVHVQGIFAKSSDGLVGKNFLVENNIIVNRSYHGITIKGGQGWVVQHNTVLADPDPENPNVATVSHDARSSNIVYKKNVVTRGGGSGCLRAQFDDPQGKSYYGELMVNPFKSSPELADFAPKAGSAIYYGSKMGAEKRFEELVGRR